MPLSNDTALISSSELSDLINKSSENLVILDATYGQNIEYTIPSAQIFDIDRVADQNAPLPHTIPTAKEFEKHAQSLGIKNDTIVVIYDQTGFWMAAARAWWMFRLFGHDNVFVLDGGLPAWDGDVAPYTPHTRDKGSFTSTFHPELYKSFDDIKENTNNGEFILVDARPDQAFNASHIEGALSLPMPIFITQQGRLKNKTELLEILSPLFDTKKDIASTCGSGVTACVLALASYECGIKNIAVYDGSWSEWRSRILN